MKIVLLFTLLTVFVACTGPGAETGFAPGAAEPNPVQTTTSSNNAKYGQQVTTSNNWQVAADSTDPVEHKVLANGWTVEVKYE